VRLEAAVPQTEVHVDRLHARAGVAAGRYQALDGGLQRRELRVVGRARGRPVLDGEARDVGCGARREARVRIVEARRDVEATRAVLRAVGVAGGIAVRADDATRPAHRIVERHTVVLDQAVGPERAAARGRAGPPYACGPPAGRGERGHRTDDHGQ